MGENPTATEPRVACIFSLTRMGSSVTAYAAGHAFDATVLDEPLGPWDRTGPPYNYPPLQNELRSAFNRARGQMNDEVAGLLRALADEMGPRVVLKLPHLQITPADLRAFFPDWGVVLLLRNPLKRLNSLYTRRWNHFTTPHADLETTREFLRRWLLEPAPQRVLYERLHADPAGFFRSIFRAWGWASDEARVGRAVRYRSEHYHESSATLHEGRSVTGVLSDHRRHVPMEVTLAYLNDPLIAAAFARCGWSRNPNDYSQAADDLAERIRRAPVPEPGTPP